jgi:hypothetical protein
MVILVTDARRHPLTTAQPGLAPATLRRQKQASDGLAEVDAGLRDEGSSLEVKSRRKIRC